MDLKKLEKLNYTELKNYGKEIGIENCQIKKVLLKNKISEIIKNYEKYKKIRQLGIKGKEGTVYLVKYGKSKKEYAMKTYPKRKSANTLEIEGKFLKTASKFNISPKVKEINLNFKFLAMEKLDYSILDLLKKGNGNLSIDIQKKMINIFQKLDEIEIFHSDPNPLNFMIKDSKLFIIDFGFAKSINNTLIKKYGTNKLNIKFMPLGFIIKVRELFKNDQITFEYLRKFVPEPERELLKV